MPEQGTYNFEIPKVNKKYNHTPGPWDADSEGSFVSLSGDASKMICDIRGWGWLQKLGHERAIEIQKANGKLIAAAPDLPELAEAILSCYKGDLSIEYLVEMAKTTLNKLK